MTLILGYPAYLLILGPYSELEGSGYINCIPQPVREIPFYPACPVYLVPGLRGNYDDYLHWWYRDPDEPDPPTGWR